MKIAHVWRVAVVLLATAVVAGCGCCTVAAALEPGVHVDPGSPAAKEYALPLSQARQTGQGSASRAGAPEALFGAGISSKRSRPARARPSARGGAPDEVAQSSQRLASARSKATVGASGDLERQAPSQQGGSDSTLALLGGSVLVLVLAAFVGVVLRGRRTSHPHQPPCA